MTILGLHTQHELTDLLAARDYTFKQVQDALAAKPSSDAQWTADWNAFASAWLAYRQTVQTWLDGWHLLSPDETVVQTSDSQNLPENAPSPSDADWWQRTLYAGYPLQELYNRFTTLPDGYKIDFSQTPQPTAPDADLNTYRAIPNVPSISLPSIARLPPAAWYVGGGVALGLALVIAIKRVL